MPMIAIDGIAPQARRSTCAPDDALPPQGPRAITGDGHARCHA